MFLSLTYEPTEMIGLHRLRIKKLIGVISLYFMPNMYGEMQGIFKTFIK